MFSSCALLYMLLTRQYLTLSPYTLQPYHPTNQPTNQPPTIHTNSQQRLQDDLPVPDDAAHGAAILLHYLPQMGPALGVRAATILSTTAAKGEGPRRPASLCLILLGRIQLVIYN